MKKYKKVSSMLLAMLMVISLITAIPADRLMTASAMEEDAAVGVSAADVAVITDSVSEELLSGLRLGIDEADEAAAGKIKDKKEKEKQANERRNPTVPKGGIYSTYTVLRSGSFEYVVDAGKAIIFGYDGTDTVVSIPEQLDGREVTAIADYAFRRCTDITEVVLPYTLVEIGNGAFFGCESLTHINIDTDRVEIGADAFRGCSGPVIIAEDADGMVTAVCSSDDGTPDGIADPSVHNGGQQVVIDDNSATVTTTYNAAITKNSIANYDKIIQEFKKGLSVYEGWIDLSSYGITVDELRFLASVIEEELPLECAAAGTGTGYSYSWVSDTGYVYGVYLDNNYDPNVTSYSQRYNKLTAVVNPFIARVKNKSVFDKLLLCHNFLIDCADYDYSYKRYCAYDILVDGSGVCQGYTKAYKMLLSLLGINNKEVTSDGMNHTWNIVWYNNEPYHVDVTWDDPEEGFKEYYNWYFMLNDDEMINNEHYGWTPDFDCSYTTFSGMPRGEMPMDFVYSNSRWYIPENDYSTSYICSYDIYGGDRMIVDSWSGNLYTSLPVINDIIYYGKGNQICCYYTNSGRKTVLYTLSTSEMNESVLNDSELFEIAVNNEGQLGYAYWVSTYDPNDGRYEFSPTGGLKTIDISLKHDYNLPKLTLTAVCTGNSSAKLSWNACADAEGYIISHGNSVDGEFKYLATTADGVISYNHTGLAAGTTHCYKVRAYRTSDTGNKLYGYLSDIKSVRIVPATPSITVKRTGATTATISWKVIPGALGYRITSATSENGTYTNLTTVNGGGNVSYTATGLSAAASYFFKVRAFCTADGVAVFGNESNPAMAVGVPVIGSASTDTNKVTVNWGAVTGATSYRVYRADTATGTKTLLKAVTATTYTDTTAVTGKTYYYFVIAYNSDFGVLGSYSAAKSVTVKAAAAIAAPTISSAVTDTNKVTLSWNSITGATSYRIYRADTKTGAKTLLKAVNPTTYTDTTAVTGKTYYYFVKAFNGTTGVLSDYSAAKEVTVKAAPAVTTIDAPVISSVSTNTNKVTINWDKVTGATSYRVYRITDGARKELAKVTATSYADTTVTTGKMYHYEVKAYNGTAGILSAYSAKRAVKVIAAPVITSANISPKITWSKVADATSYRVFRTDVATGKRILLKAVGVSTTSYTDDTAESGKTYIYYVRAYSGNASTLSDYSTGRTIKAK